MGSDIMLSALNARKCMRLIRASFPAFTPFSHICLRITTNTSVNNNQSSSNLLHLTVLTIRTRAKILIKGVTTRIPRIRNQKMLHPILQDIQRQHIVSVIQIRRSSISVRQINHSSVLDVSLPILAMGI